MEQEIIFKSILKVIIKLQTYTYKTELRQIRHKEKWLSTTRKS